MLGSFTSERVIWDDSDLDVFGHTSRYLRPAEDDFEDLSGYIRIVFA